MIRKTRQAIFWSFFAVFVAAGPLMILYARGYRFDFIKKKFPQLKVAYIKNRRYKTTNYIYSMWLARNFIDDDIILLHGDLVFEKKLLGRLLKNKLNCVLLNNNVKPPEKDFKGRVRNNIINKIGVNVSGKNAFFLAPIYKFSKSSFILWLDEIEIFINNGKYNLYAEEAFNSISGEIKLHPVYFRNEICLEIDNFDDLRNARQLFKKYDA